MLIGGSPLAASASAETDYAEATDRDTSAETVSANLPARPLAQPPTAQTAPAQTAPIPTPIAQTVNQSVLGSTQLGQWLRRFRSPRTGRPRTTGNGSSRDGLSCNATEPALQPLLSDDRYGWSLEERPKIFVDVSGTSARQALLITRNEDGSDFRQTVLPIPETDGQAHSLVSFQLPEEAPGLTKDQTYQWSLSFICGEHFTLNDPTITGWVRRVEASPEAEKVLASASVEDQAQWLSENGYWYDLTDRVVANLDEPVDWALD